MTQDDLRTAIVGIVISHMERYNGGVLSIIHREHLYKEMKADMFNMYASWWKAYFPNFHFNISITANTPSEPTVTLNWTENGQITNNWKSLTFTFNPAKLVGGDDPIKAYDRAMSVI